MTSWIGTFGISGTAYDIAVPSLKSFLSKITTEMYRNLSPTPHILSHNQYLPIFQMLYDCISILSSHRYLETIQTDNPETSLFTQRIGRWKEHRYEKSSHCRQTKLSWTYSDYWKYWRITVFCQLFDLSSRVEFHHFEFFFWHLCTLSRNQNMFCTIDPPISLPWTNMLSWIWSSLH